MALMLRACARRWLRLGTQPLRWLSSPPQAAAAEPAVSVAAVTKRGPRQLPKERIFKIMNLKTSAQKVAIVSRLVNVRGLSVQAAVGHLKFLPQKAAVFLRGLLELALRRGPIENHMDPKRMVIDSLWSGRSTYLKRADYKAKGRMGLIKKPRTSLYARVREAPEAEVEAFKLKLKKGVPDKAAYRRERKAERPPLERAHQKPRVNFWPLS